MAKQVYTLSNAFKLGGIIMGKPTSQELEQALEAAARMREHDEDPHFIAKTLLNLQYRMGFLEKVMRAAELYLRGEGAHEHTVLLRAIEAAKREDTHTEGKDAGSFFM